MLLNTVIALVETTSNSQQVLYIIGMLAVMDVRLSQIPEEIGIFGKIFSAERFWLRKFNFPFGVSIALIAKKSAGEETQAL